LTYFSNFRRQQAVPIKRRRGADPRRFQRIYCHIPGGALWYRYHKKRNARDRQGTAHLGRKRDA